MSGDVGNNRLRTKGSVCVSHDCFVEENKRNGPFLPLPQSVNMSSIRQPSVSQLSSHPSVSQSVSQPSSHPASLRSCSFQGPRFRLLVFTGHGLGALSPAKAGTGGAQAGKHPQPPSPWNPSKPSNIIHFTNFQTDSSSHKKNRGLEGPDG